MAAVLACSTVGVILVLLSPSSFTSSAAAAASSFSASSSYDEAKRYANLPPTVFSPTGRLFGVERVAREAAKMTLPYDNKDASKKNDDEDGDMTYSSCFALTCRRHGRRKWRQQLQEPCSIDEGESLLIATTTTHNLKNDKQHNGEVDDTSNDDDDYDEFAVMVGIGPQSPYLHQDIHHRNTNVNYNNSSSDEKADKNESMITKTTTKSIINSPIPYDITRKYQPLLINDDDDDDVNDDDDYDDNDSLTKAATSSSAPIAILSSHLLIGSGGKAIDSTILLHRAIEMALSLYTSSDGGLLNFISHYNDNDNDDGRIQSGGVEGVHATTLSRQLADMAQSSTQTLGGRYGRMLSSSLLVLGTQQHHQQKQQHRRTDDDNNDDNDEDINDDDTIILWRIDPTGQFYKVIASGIGRGGIYAELELMKYVRRWKRGAIYKQKQQLLSQRHQETLATTATLLTTTMEEQDEDDDEEDEGIVITTNDVQSYLGTLTPNDAIELAIDCLVNGIVASSSTIGGRSNGGSTINSREQQQQQQQQQRWHDDKDKYDVLSSYKEELRRRVHAVIIHSQIHEF